MWRRKPKQEIAPHPDQGVWLRNGRWDRWGPRAPSVEIQMLHREAPRLYDQDPDRLCISSSKNFCGALFYALHQENFLIDLMKQSHESEHNFAAPHEMNIPFRMLHNVPLFSYDKTNRKHLPLQQSAPLVLLKQTSGTESAVILQGPFTGVILDTYDDLPNASQGMTVNRIWNDELIHEQNLPYAPRYWTMSKLLYNDEAEKLESEFDQKFLAYLRKERFQLPLWTTALFVHLCDKTGIPLDKKNFFYLRAQDSIEQKSHLRHTR